MNGAPAQSPFPNQVHNGREYHGFKHGQYLYPCDAAEQDVMDLGYGVISHARRGQLITPGEAPSFYHSAPIDWHQRDRVRILDLGCGTGNWVMDMALEYPLALIYGVDLVNIQPTNNVPANVVFRAFEDYEEDLSFLPENSFDLIRISLGCGSVHDWKTLYEKLIRFLKPGIGCFEQVEFDFEPRSINGSLPLRCDLKNWYADLKSTTRLHQRPIQWNPFSPELLKEAGFVNVTEDTIEVPVNGSWPEEPHKQQLGFFYAMWAHNPDGPPMLEGLSMKPLTWVGGRPQAEVQSTVRGALKDILRPHWCTFNELHILTARRP